MLLSAQGIHSIQYTTPLVRFTVVRLVCFYVKAALCGGYVNFGVFRLYGDSALDGLKNLLKNLPFFILLL